MKLAIIGAGELGRLAAHHAVNDSHYELVGFYDDVRQGPSFEGFPVFGAVEQVLADFDAKRFDKVFIAIGYSQMKARAGWYERLKGRIPLATIIHSTCYVDPSCTVGEGSFLLPRCTLDFGVVLKDNVLLNTGVTIAHHTVVSENCFIGPGVRMAGLIRMMPNCFIGTGATITNSIEIARNSVVGAGAVVIKSTSEDSVSVGVPAKQLAARAPT
jgi:sugar O-acyltransferase (sialic acid O-acetyltransferase NeuD family)